MAMSIIKGPVANNYVSNLSQGCSGVSLSLDVAAFVETKAPEIQPSAANSEEIPVQSSTS